MVRGADWRRGVGAESAGAAHAEGRGWRMGPRRRLAAALLPLPGGCGGGRLGAALLGAALLGGVLLGTAGSETPPGDGAEPCRACRGLAESFSRVRSWSGGGKGSAAGRWGGGARGGGMGVFGGDGGRYMVDSLCWDLTGR